MNELNRTSLGQRFRTAPIEQSAVDKAARTVRLSISSDTPYLRSDFMGQWWEILDHSPGQIVSDRLEQGVAMLFNHQRDIHLGRGVSFKNDGHRIEVLAKFSRSAIGEEKFQDALDGLLTQSSVGYNVVEIEELEPINGIQAYRAKWEPLEFSLVTIAADISVGVGREQSSFHPTKNTMNDQETTTQEQPSERNAMQERERINGIRFIAGRETFKSYLSEADVQRAIDSGMSSSAFGKQVLKLLPAQRPIQNPIGGNGDLSVFASERGSIGERIVSRSDYQEFAKNSGRGKMFKVEFPEVVGTRALTVSGAALTGFDKQPGVVALGVQQLLVADLLMQAQTSMPTVRFIREDSFTNSATAVSEAGTKPNADLDLSEIDAPVRKIAVVSKVSDELIQDFAQVETFLNGRLGYMVSAVLDAQIVNGDGIAPNLLGLLNTAGIQTQAKATDTALDAIFLAITKVNSVGFFKADGIIMHPNDWAALRLTKDSNNQYFGSGPFYAPYGNQLVPIQVPTVWQLPVAVTTAIAQGVGLVGAFKQCATIFWRKGLFVDMTNSNEDDFRKNLVSVRAELRAAVICQSPLGLCQITGLPA